MSYRFQQPAPPPGFEQSPTRRWLPAAIIGAAIVIAAGLVAGALILKDGSSGAGTCQAWKQTRLNLLAVPALPNGWGWTTPDIDTAISRQNAAVKNALDVFEDQIVAKPANVADAARQYVFARRTQMQTLADHTYTGSVGQAVDAALDQLDRACAIDPNGRPT